MDIADSGSCAAAEFVITGVEFSDYATRVCYFYTSLFQWTENAIV
jgi:hypothetical protein